MKLLNSEPVANGSVTFFLPDGNYSGFVIIFDGVNDAGNQATLADLGNILLTRLNEPLVNVPASFISQLNDKKGGFPTFSSALAGAFYAFLYIPCGDFDDENNSYYVNKSERWYFKLDFPLLQALALSGVVKIYGVYKEGIQNYLYCLTSRNVNSGGAGVYADTHRLPNVSKMYLDNISVIDRATIIRDNELMFDGETSDLLAFSDFNNKTEVASTLIEMDMNMTKSFKESLSNEIQFKYDFNGAGLLQQYFAYKKLTSDVAVKSAVANNQKIESKVSSGLITSVPSIIPVEQLGRVSIDNKY